MKKILQLYRDNAGKPKQFKNLVSVNGDEATFYLYDMVSADWGVSALSVIEALAQAKDAKVLTVHINSPGGDVFEGRAIMAALSAFNGKTVAKIDSLCASAATSIAMACDQVVMAEGAFFMIHNASGMAWGDKQDLRDTADVLEKVEGAIVNDYVQKTGKEAAEIRAMMAAETWFTAKEAVDHGFVDGIAVGKSAVNTWNLSAFANAPKAELPPEPPPDVLEPAKPQEPAQAGFFMSTVNANRLRLVTLA